MKNFYQIKTVSLSDFDGKSMITDVDEKSRTITGYASRFGNIDSDGDMLMPGAFTKTLKERGSEGKNLIIHLGDHDMQVMKILGKPKLSEKADGLHFETTISNTNFGNDVLQLYKDGVINQHSFGFRTIKNEDGRNKEGGFNKITEVMLYEISTVVLGANEQATFTGFKSMSKPELISRYKILTGAMNSKSYTDETFVILDAQIKQIESYFIELALKAEMCPECGNEMDESKECKRCKPKPKSNDTELIQSSARQLTAAIEINNLVKLLKR